MRLNEDELAARFTAMKAVGTNFRQALVTGSTAIWPEGPHKDLDIVVLVHDQDVLPDGAEWMELDAAVDYEPELQGPANRRARLVVGKITVDLILTQSFNQYDAWVTATYKTRDLPLVLREARETRLEHFQHFKEEFRNGGQ